MKKNLLSIICFFACLFSIQAQTLYDITYNGGKDGVGTIIKFTPATNNLTVVKSFENSAKWPQYTNLIQAFNGKLYGMTSNGGFDGIGGIGFGGGAIFSFDPSTSTYTKLKNFDGPEGANPYGSLVQAGNGKLYGMTSLGGSNNRGVIFSFDPSSSTYTKLKDFDGTNGGNPYGSLIQAGDGKLYGMTYTGGLGGGVIFSFDPSTSTYTKLKDFDYNNTGNSPYGSLVQAGNGKLYGMTHYGGSSDAGVIFSYDPSTSTYTKLKDFNGTDGAKIYGSLIQANDGKLYGMTSRGGINNPGVIFSFDPSTSIFTKLKDLDVVNGSSPEGSLMKAANGMLYGMTSRGGSNDYGVIFSFDPTSSTYTKVKDFDAAIGGDPLGSLVQAGNGKLYGLTTRGGGGGGNSGGFGVIFSFDPSSSIYTKLKSFAERDGRSPSNLLLASDGKFYGTTSIMNALSGNDAVIFSFDPSSSVYTKLMDFDSANIVNSFGSFIQASDGKLYGMAGNGGGVGNGVIFSFDPLTSTYAKLKDFDGINGRYAYGSLLQASNGKLYGMTVSGGSSDYGVIFSFDLSSSTYTKLVDFDNTNGANPYGSLVQAGNGKLYGMTSKGGSNNYGVIFSFDPSTSAYTKLVDFGSANAIGSNPYGSLIQASDGKLYGMAGVIFSFDPSTSTYTKLEDFPYVNGAYANGVVPLGNLMQASNGKLYGMTFRGGNNDAGVVFSLDPSSSTYTKLKDFDSAYGAYAYRYFIGSAFIEIPNSGGNGTIPALSIAITSGTNSTCPGQSITFTATPTNGGASPIYQWKVNGTNVGTNSPTYTSATLTNGQVVSCVMTSNAPNANPTTATSNTITMTVNAVVIPTIVITQTSCRGDSVIFSSTITNGGTAPAYLWTYNGTGGVTNNTSSEFSLKIPFNGTQVQCRLTSNAPCANPVQVNSSPLIINCMTTGVSNIDNLEEFKIMPNPSNGLFTVKIKLNTQREVRFSVLNSQGQPVYQSPSTRMNGTQTKQINMSSLPGAIYFLKTEIGNQVTYKRIIIIKK